MVYPCAERRNSVVRLRCPQVRVETIRATHRQPPNPWHPELTSGESTTVRRTGAANVRSSRLLIRSLHSSASRWSSIRRHMRMRASSAVIFCLVALDTSLPHSV